jgi:hypothetical protein
MINLHLDEYRIKDMLQSRQNYPKQLESETDQRYYFFIDYLKLGPKRTMKKFTDINKLSRSTLFSYANKFNWFERAMEFDSKEQDDHRNRTEIEFNQSLDQLDILCNLIMTESNQIVSKTLQRLIERRRTGEDMREYDEIINNKKDETPNKEKYDKKINNRNKITLQFFETYLRIAYRVQKIRRNRDKNYIPQGDLNDKKVLEDIEYYKKDLTNLQTLLKTQTEELHIFDELAQVSQTN